VIPEPAAIIPNFVCSLKVLKFRLPFGRLTLIVLFDEFGDTYFDISPALYNLMRKCRSKASLVSSTECLDGIGV
jgi:hypothetical protein